MSIYSLKVIIQVDTLSPTPIGWGHPEMKREREKADCVLVCKCRQGSVLAWAEFFSTHAQSSFESPNEVDSLYKSTNPLKTLKSRTEFVQPSQIKPILLQFQTGEYSLGDLTSALRQSLGIDACPGRQSQR